MMQKGPGPVSMRDGIAELPWRVKLMPSSFESDYPAITRWIQEFGYIEIGGDSFTDNFIKAVNREGMIWGGKREYTTIDEALKDIERGIKEALVEQTRSSPGRTRKTRSQAAKRSGKAKSRVDPNQH